LSHSIFLYSYRKKTYVNTILSPGEFAHNPAIEICNPYVALQD
jgi:hypothetical protein